MLVLKDQTEEMKGGGACKLTLSSWDVASINISLDREFERIERAYPGADDGENSRSRQGQTQCPSSVPKSISRWYHGVLVKKFHEALSTCKHASQGYLFPPKRPY